MKDRKICTSDSSTQWVLNDRSFLISLSTLVLLSLSYDSVKFLVRTEYMPLVSLLVLGFFIFFIDKSYITSLFKTTMAFFVFMVLISFLMLISDVKTLNNPLRISTFVRQFVAFIWGGMTYIVLRRAIVMKRDDWWKPVFIGFLPSLGIAFIHLLYFVFRKQYLFNIVFAIRNLIMNYSVTSFRVSGLCAEPSSYGKFIILVLLPLLVIYKKELRKKQFYIFSFLIFSTFIGTISFTAILLFIVFTSLYLLFSRKYFFMLFTFLVMVSVLVLSYFLFPDTYMFRVLGMVFSGGRMSTTFIDKFYSFWGPITHVFNSRIIIGYGFGGDSIYLNDFLPPGIVDMILRIKERGSGVLTSNFGKILVYGGVGAFLIYLKVFITAFRLIDRTIVAESSKYKEVAKASLISIFFGYIFSMGNFTFVYLWFWLAYIDSMYYRSCTREVNVRL